MSVETKDLELTIPTEIDTVDNVNALGEPALPPKDGLRAWIVCVGCCFAAMSTFGATSAFGVFQAYYQSTLLPNQSASSIAWIGSIQYCLLFFMGIPTGVLHEMGWTRHLIIGGSITIFIAQLCVSWCKEYWQLVLVQGVIYGFGEGMVFTPVNATLVTWFDRRRGLANAFLASGSAVGGTVFGIMSSSLLKSVGFPWTARILAFVLLVLLTAPCLLVRRYPQLPPSLTSTAPVKTRRLDFSAIHDPLFVLYVAACFFASLAIYAPVNYMQAYSEHLGLTTGYLSYIVSIMNGVSIIGRLASGQISDIVGAHRTMAPGMAVCGILIFIWTRAFQPGAIVGFSAVYAWNILTVGRSDSVSMGIYVTMIPLGALEVLPRAAGRSIGLLFSVSGAALLVSQPIFGAFINEKKSGSEAYLHASIWGGCVLLLSAVLVAVANVLVRRRRNRMEL